MLEKENTLPCSEGKIAFVYRDYFAGASQCHSQMAWTVVRALVGVDKIGKILRNKVIEKGMQIGSRLRICVLHDDQTGAGVADKNSELTALNPRFIKEVPDFPGEFIGPFSACGNGKFARVSFKVHQQVWIS